jgi:AbrB family looped-hinge helix DNA binding protein
MKATVSEKGQVTIPKALRDRLGIRPGQILEFETADGRLIARKAASVDPVDAVYGTLKADGLTVDEIIEDMRGPARP